MSTTTFEHRIVKFEVDNHCILLRDEKKADYSSKVGGQKLLVRVPDGKTYEASLNEFYIDGKFQAGIHFEGGAENAFIVEQTLFPGHLAKLTVGHAAEGGRFPVDVELYVKTK